MTHASCAGIHLALGKAAGFSLAALFQKACFFFFCSLVFDELRSDLKANSLEDHDKPKLKADWLSESSRLGEELEEVARGWVLN